MALIKYSDLYHRWKEKMEGFGYGPSEVTEEEFKFWVTSQIGYMYDR